MENILIIDSNPQTYIDFPKNSIPIEPWSGDMQDQELLNLIPIMEQLSKVKNVTEVVERVMAKMKENYGVEPEKFKKKQLSPDDIELYDRFLGNKVPGDYRNTEANSEQNLVTKADLDSGNGNLNQLILEQFQTRKM